MEWRESSIFWRRKGRYFILSIMRTAFIHELRRQSPSSQPVPVSREESAIFREPTVSAALGKRIWASPSGIQNEIADESLNDQFHPIEDHVTAHRVSPLEQWMRERDEEDGQDSEDDRTVTTMADVPLPTVFSSSPSIAGRSDSLSSISLSSSISKRPSRHDYSVKRLCVEVMEKDLLTPCSCSRLSKFGRKSCHSHFNLGDILNLRRERTTMDQTAERKTCIKEMMQAMNHPQERILVGCKVVPYRECCIGGYCLAYGLSRKTVHRLRIQLQSGVHTPNEGAGRPKKTREDLQDDKLLGPSSPDQQYIQAWLNEWIEIEGDHDPVGDECQYVLDLVDCKDVYEEFIADYGANTIFSGCRQPSERTFRRVWEWWVVENRVRIRDKKNTTTKCQGLQDLMQG